MGVGQVWLTGYTPYPVAKNDKRLPYLASKIDHQIDKTALGAAQMVAWRHEVDIEIAISKLRQEGFTIVGLEQAPDSIKLPDFEPPEKLALVVGREVEGLEPETLQLCDLTVEIPMLGRKESFNVAVAAAMALYACRFQV